MLAMQQSGMLRVACYYCMDSESAVLVIMGIIPVKLIAQEQKQVYKSKAKVGKLEAHKEACLLYTSRCV